MIKYEKVLTRLMIILSRSLTPFTSTEMRNIGTEKINYLIFQVHAVVLPAKRKRYKTKVQHINSPYFGETFKISQVSPEDLRGIGLRFRLYGIGKVSIQTAITEASFLK